MDRTPNGNHEIRTISGEAEIIERRGREIESLGIQMKEAAGVLALVKDGAETRGKSLDSIKDSVGDAVKDLERAGARYEPSGYHLKLYGAALWTAQTSSNGVVTEAERLWAIYETKSSAWSDLNDSPEPDGDAPRPEGSPDPVQEREEGIATAAGEKQGAYDDWKVEADKYDGFYETWVEAYDDARSGLHQANEDGVEDGFWDDALPAIEAILEVLSWVGLVLAVLVIVVGAPWMIIAAAIVGLVVLALTIVRVAKGRGSGWDIAVAVIGVLPFGKIAGAFKGVIKAGSGARGIAAIRGVRDVATEMGGLTNIRQLRHLRQVTNPANVRNLLHGDGSINVAGTRRLRERLAAMGNASNSSTPLQRILNGQENVLGSNVRTIMDNGSAVVRTRVTAALGDSYSGRVVQGLMDSGGTPSGVDRVVNVIDSVGRPGGNFLYDQTQ